MPDGSGPPGGPFMKFRLTGSRVSPRAFVATIGELAVAASILMQATAPTLAPIAGVAQVG